MNEPNWTSFFLRVGGVCAAFAVVILVTRHYFNGYTGWAVMATSVVLVAGVAAKELRAKQRTLRRRERHKKAQ